MSDWGNHSDKEVAVMELTIGEIKGQYPALVELTNTESAMSDAAYDLAYSARVELLTLWGVFNKPQGDELHTLVACTVCKRGVQNQHSVNGMCPTCAEAELERLRELLARAHELLEAHAPNHPLVDTIALEATP